MASPSEDLQNEIEALNSIYGDDTLTSTFEADVYVLRLLQQDASLRLQFLYDYPSTPPFVLGTHSSGALTRKGNAADTLAVFQDTLDRLFQPGQVCLFDVIEEVNSHNESEALVEDADQHAYGPESAPSIPEEHELEKEPPWTLSSVLIENKSIFIARCAPVSSPTIAKAYLQHLLEHDKKVRSATHNITAWRIKGANNTAYQDCDDDGETAAGGRVLHLMQLMDVWDVMVVVTRWYGGEKLGPKRFSVINAAARDAFVKSGLVSEEGTGRKKPKK